MSEQGILLFSLSGRRLAVGVESVRRIASAHVDGDEWIHETVFGVAPRRTRGLVAKAGERERILAVDHVEGIEMVPSLAVRPLPLLAKDALETRGVGGLVLLEEELVPLVDLPRLVLETSKENSHAETE